jgi:predicted DNA-binding transcriptional regulator YafY
MMLGTDPETHKIILSAIQQKRQMRFVFEGKERIAEPHDYGVQNGITRLLAWQTGGQSSGPIPGWRWFGVDRISGMTLLERTFPGNRPAPSGRHHQWDALYARVSPASE